MVDDGGRALILELVFLLMKSVKRADNVDVPGGCAMKKRFLPSPSDPPTSPLENVQ